MSKKIEDSELQTLTLSPTNTNDDESSLFINPASDETTFPISPPPAFPPAPPPAPPVGEKRKLERISSVPVSGVKTVPTLRVSTPPGSARISYANEKTSGKMDFSKITRDRPTPGSTISQKKDVADVRQIEQGLLQLMEDFQAGNLRAFGKDSRLRQMEAIREQQERLARLHFDVGAEQDLHPPLSEEGLKTSHENMRTLMEKLAQLSESIERLHTNTSSDRKTSSNERKSANHQVSSNQPSTQRISDHANHSNLNTGASENISSRSGDPLNVTSPLATSSPQNANIGNSFSNNANHHSSPVGSNTAQGQQNANNANRNRNSGGYQSTIKNGKNAES
ncbi:putative uncharacterized protein DDB_G0279653 isoform X2 [Macrobrachium nipponense]|uniref:putative uncharacterized protein DDB_G0279653 isoform X2 n=1 Tax=Macrobrachium nipponense TaxID=159736 RepID=UPI0030C8147E